MEDRGRATLRRDYGLTEFFWSRRPGSEPWYPGGFSIQAHRLPGVEVGDELVDRYGRFGGRLRFARLREELARLGYQLEEISSDADRPGYRRFWLAESQVMVAVTAAGSEGSGDGGEVWSIAAPRRTETVAATKLGVRHQAVKDGLTHLLRLGDAERVTWLDRRQPPPDERVNWWLDLLLVIDAQLGDQPAGARLGGAQAVAAAPSAHPGHPHSRRERDECGVLRRPTASDRPRPARRAVRRRGRPCLPGSHLVGLDEVALFDDRRDLRCLDRRQVIHSRQAKNLVGAAEWHLDQLQDHALADRLRQWLVVKPRLVQGHSVGGRAAGQSRSSPEIITIGSAAHRSGARGGRAGRVASPGG